MNIGNRKKQAESEYIPEFTKRCDIGLLECKYCMNFDKEIQWCLLYKDEYIKLIQEGKKIKRNPLQHIKRKD